MCFYFLNLYLQQIMTIQFVYNTDFKINNESQIQSWITLFCKKEGFSIDSLVFAFFNDEELKKLNVKFLSHDYYTDVISFDESKEKMLKGNIAVSVERVADNAKSFSVDFNEELRRVLVHGILHFMGFNDKNKNDITLIRNKEELALSMFHVKH